MYAEHLYSWLKATNCALSTYLILIPTCCKFCRQSCSKTNSNMRNIAIQMGSQFPAGGKARCALLISYRSRIFLQRPRGGTSLSNLWSVPKTKGNIKGTMLFEDRCSRPTTTVGAKPFYQQNVTTEKTIWAIFPVKVSHLLKNRKIYTVCKTAFLSQS